MPKNSGAAGAAADMRDMLKRHEGVRKLVYNDATGATVKPVEGYLTIGVGHNLSVPMDETLIDIILDYDIRKATRNLIKVFPNLHEFGQRRGNVLIALMFNIGPGSFRGFEKMIAAIEGKKWGLAADELKDSEWYRTVGPGRGDEMVAMLR